jgi:hypothetical protein
VVRAGGRVVVFRAGRSAETVREAGARTVAEARRRGAVEVVGLAVALRRTTVVVVARGFAAARRAVAGRVPAFMVARVSLRADGRAAPVRVVFGRPVVADAAFRRGGAGRRGDVPRVAARPVAARDVRGLPVGDGRSAAGAVGGSAGDTARVTSA